MPGHTYRDGTLPWLVESKALPITLSQWRGSQWGSGQKCSEGIESSYKCRNKKLRTFERGVLYSLV